MVIGHVLVVWRKLTRLKIFVRTFYHWPTYTSHHTSPGSHIIPLCVHMHRHLPRDLRIGYTILNVQKSVEIWEFSRNPPFLQHHPAAPPNTRTSGTRAHDLKITIAPPTGRFCLVNTVASNADLCCPLFVEQTSSRDMI